MRRALIEVGGGLLVVAMLMGITARSCSSSSPLGEHVSATTGSCQPVQLAPMKWTSNMVADDTYLYWMKTGLSPQGTPDYTQNQILRVARIGGPVQVLL